MPQTYSRDRKPGRTGLKHETWMRAGLGVAVAAFVVCANPSAVRAGDDSDGPSAMSAFMHTLGLQDPRSMEYGIDYNERSPLVVPPTRDLPPPAKAAPPPVADWPKDPDITKRAAAKAKKAQPHNVDWTEDARPLRPDELNRVGAALPPSSGTAQQGQSNPPDPSAKKSIFSFDWLKKEQYATFTGEPARTNLTDPPPGYLTPSPDQPYGVGPEKKKYTPPTVADRMEPQK